MIVGVDVGGTFTDIIALDPQGGVRAGKVLTRPQAPWRGVLEAMQRVDVDPGSVETLIHATTLGTNLFLGQEGLEPPRVALITNRGFRDVLEIGRQNRPELYNPLFTRPPPLVPRDRRVGVGGRIGPRGKVIEDLDPGEVEEAAQSLCTGTDVFVIAFINSHVNSVHEDLAEEAVRRGCPGAVVVKSSSVDPQEGEYERTSTTVVNGVLRPILSRYLERLHAKLKSRGFNGTLLVMQSSGGVTGAARALERPAAFIESGPAAGAVAVAHYSRFHGVENALGFDMGGTTAKASSIHRGEPDVVDEYEVGGRAHMGRRLRGSGYPVRYPHIDLAEVGAGGGTIAWVDPGGALRVGPQSAGSSPGPTCYGLGGREPTVTDANLLLGRLPGELAGGAIRLNERLAREAIAGLAARAGLEPLEAAWGIVRIANTIMARALRLVTVERGRDPRTYTLYAFGGAGPLHGAELAVEMGISRVIVPPYPGVFSSLGLTLADHRVDLHKSILGPARERGTWARVEEALDSMEREARRLLEEEGVPPDKVTVARLVEMRYRGQSAGLKVPYTGAPGLALQRFLELYEARYGFTLPGEEVEVSLARVTAVGLTGRRAPRAPPPGKRVEAGPRGSRRVYFPEGWVEAGLYLGEDVAPGAWGRGPGLIMLPDSTVLVPPGWGFRVWGDGSIVLEEV